MKKFAAILLTFALFLTSSTASAQLISPEDQPSTLNNPLSSPIMSKYMSNYDTAMAWAFENNILTGDGTTGDLRETDCVKRAEIIKMLYNVLQIDTADSQAQLFADTYADQWYAPFVKKARERNTIRGYEDGTFKPAQCVNRAEALKMALLEFPNINPTNTPVEDYSDVPSSEWYYQYVSYALGNFLVGLKHIQYSFDNNSMNYLPGESMTREEVAEMLYRLKTLQDNNLTSYDDAYGPQNVIKTPLKTYNLEQEEFFDYDTSLLAVLDTQDKNQTTLLNGFLSKSPAGNVDGFVKDILKDFATDLSKVGLSYDSDLLPSFGDGFKVMYAVGESSSFVPRQTLLITVDDSAKLTNVFNKMSALNGYTRASLFGFKTFTNEKQHLYLAYTDDSLLAWPSFGDRYLALQKIKNGGENLLQNKSYNDLIASVPTPNVGMIYFGSAVEGSGVFAVIPSISGLNVHYRVDGLNSLNGKAPYMYKNLPGNNLLSYGESYGLINILDATGADLLAGLKESGVIVSGGDWLNQGYASVLQDTGTIIPGISLYFDATGYTDQAQQDIDNLDALIVEMIDQIKAENTDYPNVIVKDTAMVDGKSMNRIKIDFSMLPPSELGDLAMFGDTFTDPIELYYGINSDNYVTLALYSGYNNVYGKVASVSENADVKVGMSYLSGYPNAFSFLSVENILGYVDSIVAEIEKTQPMPADEKAGYTEFMDYLAPIKYIVGAEKDFTDFAGGLMFVKID